MKKLFEEPKIEVELFAVEDVITASSAEVVTYDADELIIAVNHE